MLKKVLPLVLAGLSLVGCQSTPSESELAGDIGKPPSHEDAKQVLAYEIERRLLDPGSAQVRWSPMVQRSWYRIGFGKPVVAWSLWANVNAKNRLGGYTGFRPWAAWFRDGNLIAVSSPISDSGASYAEAVGPHPIADLVNRGTGTERLIDGAPEAASNLR